jgi:hypothetical protein
MTYRFESLHGAAVRLCPPLAIALLVALGIPGCGGPDGPPRYPVEGTVTYQGEPVPVGRIVFEPDDSKGIRGPAASATIDEGRFETRPGKGAVGGPHRVRIQGYEGGGSGEAPMGPLLFSEHRTTVDLPEEASTHDFEVPASAQ